MLIKGKFVSRNTSNATFYDIQSQREIGTPASKLFYELPRHDESCLHCYRMMNQYYYQLRLLQSSSEDSITSNCSEEEMSKEVESKEDEVSYSDIPDQFPIVIHHTCGHKVKISRTGKLPKFCRKIIR